MTDKKHSEIPFLIDPDMPYRVLSKSTGPDAEVVALFPGPGLKAALNALFIVWLTGFYKQWLDELMSYESQAFSASAEGLTEKEAQKMMLKLAERYFQRDVDGVLLSLVLEEVRS